MMEFWLTFNNNAEVLQLPVNPDSIRISYGMKYTDLNVSQLGEYSIINNKTLSEYSFSSFFPRDENPSFCEYSNIPKPWTAVEKIRTWQTSGNPLRLTITGTPINSAVTVRNFDIEEKAGEVGDLYYSLSLKEYKFITFQTITESNTTQESERPPVQKESVSGKTYIVKSGDSLYKIATKFLGEGSRYKEIYELNMKLIGSNPNLIFPGQKLILP
ncbi:LysM peptidoglycan-binding domain-containing protein [Chengkuizengella axinellae]|uniref:LysM peptidoglycan-binding domain-containing protein n=1 Tax=Chengkuizengella axinellae TaxID=3064388 RepID=A0ABT9IW10_9BACL|nr:LysM peptidoglycan-binding domain-containing protein [Chengkuizengella sp. 2205SS18-9]MDP5273551.1 LysM peptidoglycan-binding domain-containing protein [Chengkuizengella sp. 2205SS18-9]